MPFKSASQRRKFGAMVGRGEISPSTFKEWNDATGKKKLPERVKKKKPKPKEAPLTFQSLKRMAGK